LYLLQIPPYVFGKPIDYFDKIYAKFNSDHDKYYLEEEKYEGNDLYEIYKSKTSENADTMEHANNNMETNYNSMVVYRSLTR